MNLEVQQIYKEIKTSLTFGNVYPVKAGSKQTSNVSYTKMPYEWISITKYNLYFLFQRYLFNNI